MLRVDRAGRRFPNGTVALQDVSLRIDRGDFIALLGPSGCGKSTLLRLIAGLDQPDSGAIVWETAPGDIGFVFQDPTLLPWANALENVLLPLRLRRRDAARSREAARAALAGVGLAGFETALPRQLSGGMRMRVSIARSLVVAPSLLLMDEPFAALDEFTRHALQDDLRRLWTSAGCAVVFVTHSIYEAAYLARRIVVMSPRPGRIAAEIDSKLAAEADRRLDPAYAALVAEVTEAFRQIQAA
ncbi:MAG TPA: ABC transporter ATP-binding protein [Acetobacteraceae bacterium]|nr:ABC transporter ATP-binding protein [Acetobacteraceae bacterium]